MGKHARTSDNYDKFFFLFHLYATRGNAPVFINKKKMIFTNTLYTHQTNFYEQKLLQSKLALILNVS